MKVTPLLIVETTASLVFPTGINVDAAVAQTAGSLSVFLRVAVVFFLCIMETGSREKWCQAG